MKSQSVEFIHATVTSDVDVSVDPVHMAITKFNIDPVSADWKVAVWETDGITCKILVGPLDKGRYTVWVKINDSSEIPVLEAGSLLVD